MPVSTSARQGTPMMVVCSRSDERRAAVAAQLKERYSATYEVVSVATSSEGAEALVAASGEDRQVAILLADDPASWTTDTPSSRSPPGCSRTHDGASSWSGGPGVTGTPPTWC